MYTLELIIEILFLHFAKSLHLERRLNCLQDKHFSTGRFNMWLLNISIDLENEAIIAEELVDGPIMDFKLASCGSISLVATIVTNS